MKITSVNNDIVKETAKLHQRKFRDESGLFLIEGEKCIEEALDSGITIKRIFVTEGFNKFNKFEPIETNDAVLSKISTTDSAPKAVAVGEKPKYKWSDKYKKVVLLENIKDAGNLGTILRTACAFNIDAIILYGDTVDLYNPKCVRSSVGNLWKIPVFEISDFDKLKEMFENYERIGTLPKCSNSIWLNDYIPSEKTLLMFGAESTGLTNNLKDFATKNITIEMSKNVESLNLSVSAAVILYKFINA